MSLFRKRTTESRGEVRRQPGNMPRASYREIMDIENVIDAIRRDRVRITDHADEEAVADNLTFDEIYFSVLHGEIIESYPADKP